MAAAKQINNFDQLDLSLDKSLAELPKAEKLKILDRVFGAWTDKVDKKKTQAAKKKR